MSRYNLLKNKRAISSVLATVIIVVVTITMAISASFWVGGLTSIFNRFEKIEVKDAYVVNSGGNYIVTLRYENTGSSPTSIDSISLNDVIYTSYTPSIKLGGNFSALPSSCETGITKTGTIVIQEGATDPSGNILAAGVALSITLHSIDDKNYFAIVTLQGGGGSTLMDQGASDQGNITAPTTPPIKPGNSTTPPIDPDNSTTPPTNSTTNSEWRSNSITPPIDNSNIPPINDSSIMGIRSVGTFSSYGPPANIQYDTDPGTWDAFPTYGPTSSPSNRFNFAYLTGEYGVTDAGSKFNDYLRAIRSQNRVPLYRLYWGHTYNDLAGTESKIRTMMSGVDTTLLGGVIFDDDTRWNDPGVPQFLNSLYDWFKSTYPGVTVYQVWAPRENEGPADGRPGFQSSWKADGWVWYSYWANYGRTKAFIQSCKSAQPGKPIIMIVDFSAPWGSGFDPYAYTSQQVRVAREEGCSVCLFSYSSSDRRSGWWTSDLLTQQRYAAGEALIDEVEP